jgi:polysaccharide biosynthesis/export protein
MHKGGDGVAPGTQELKISPLMGSHDSKLNVPVYPGDVVKVSAADVVYVVGAVNKPGAYPMPGNARVTAVRALALGQGFAPGAQGSAIVVRIGPRGERLEIPVDLNAALKGKAGDVALQAHDVLFVPTSAGKVAGRQALDAFTHIFALRPW